MRYTVVCGSDVGRKKTVNQDALAIKHLIHDKEEVVFAVLCDGMGGFEQGEIASATVVMAFVKWFNEVFLSQTKDMDKERICHDWSEIIHKSNRCVYKYGVKNGIHIGTTATVLLIWKNEYFIINIGDCRVYKLCDSIAQITKDHSVVAREVEMGLLTKEQARHDKRRNQLLKCIGDVNKAEPDFFIGKVQMDAVYMLCCDGVRNKVSDEELFYYFHPKCMREEAAMNNNMKYIFELNKLRKENDNMSVILIKGKETSIHLECGDDATKIAKEEILLGSKQYIEIV